MEVKSVMATFDFIFSCYLDKWLIKQSDNLWKTLQGKQKYAAYSQYLALIVIKMFNQQNVAAIDLTFFENELHN